MRQISIAYHSPRLTLGLTGVFTGGVCDRNVAQGIAENACQALAGELAAALNTCDPEDALPEGTPKDDDSAGLTGSVDPATIAENDALKAALAQIDAGEPLLPTEPDAPTADTVPTPQPTPPPPDTDHVTLPEDVTPPPPQPSPDNLPGNRMDTNNQPPQRNRPQTHDFART